MSDVSSSSEPSNNKVQSSARFHDLLAELERLRPDLNDEKIIELIKSKKEKVGGGFLTDQGALFLIASEMGVTLKPALLAPSKLSDLNDERRDISLVARILSIGQPKVYIRKSDSSRGFILRISLYDSSSAAVMNIWNKDIASSIIKSNLQPGDTVKISGAYTKKGPDKTALSLSIADGGELKRADERDSLIAAIPTIDRRSVEPGRATTLLQEGSIVVRGRISGATRRNEFGRKDGSRSHYISFGLMENDPEASQQNNHDEIRVVLWENSNPVFDKLTIGENVTILNVRAKLSEYLGNKTVELHGDEATCILERWPETKLWLEERFGAVMEELTRVQARQSEPQSKITNSPTPFIARVISIGEKIPAEEKSSPSHFLLIDSMKRKISLNALDVASENVSDIHIDDVVVCKPDSFDQTGLKAICTKAGGILKVKPERKDIPTSSTLVTEIDRLEPDSIVTLDCMALSQPSSREIQTKDGLQKRTEISLGDPSGEIKLYAWRTLSKQIEPLKAGSRFWLHAVEVQSREGRKYLMFKNYSKIETVS